MTDILGYLPGMLALLAVSGFFSGSESAFFSLTPAQRSQLQAGKAIDQLAFRLVDNSERLLMGILFWNLAINLAYFSIVSKAALAGGEANAAIVTVLSLLLIIVCGEFLPKSLAVTYPVTVVRCVVYPLSLAMRIADPLLPTIRLVNEASRRMIWPGFETEAYLEIEDLDRAVKLSAKGEHLFERESEILRNVIRLKEIRAEEWMRPRSQYLAFRPPVHVSQLNEETPPSGYMLVTDEDGHEVEYAIDLSAIGPDQGNDLGALMQPVVILPWCCSVVDALIELKSEDLRVAVVVNEFGDSIGILTLEDIFETILQTRDLVSQSDLARAEVEQVSDGIWLATGLTKLRQLERVLDRDLSRQNLTIAGVIQEQRGRLAETGDTCVFEGLKLEVLEAADRGQILVRISLTSRGREESS
ncbi:MAG: CNNM domain-containing protein [Pirellulaceae bacterium]